jgi:hypothetical protein
MVLRENKQMPSREFFRLHQRQEVHLNPKRLRNAACVAAATPFALLAACGSSSPSGSSATAEVSGSSDTNAKNLAQFIGQWQRSSGEFSQVCAGDQGSAQAQAGTATLSISAALSGSGADLAATVGGQLDGGTCVALLNVNGATATLVPPGPTCSGDLPGIGTTTATITTETLVVVGTTMNRLEIGNIVYPGGGAASNCVGTTTASFSK